MKIPVSWLREFVDSSLSPLELARCLTLSGLEVEDVRFVGLPLPRVGQSDQPAAEPRGSRVSGLEWDPEKFVVGAVNEVMPHPDADRLVLCRLDDGQQEHIVLAGGSNLFPFKGRGTLEEPLKVAYAREGARLYDGHQTGWELMTLKRTKIRGVVSYSMACSEKELGISENHEHVILLDPDAPTGMPLVDYMGDAVLDVTLIPNMARDANVLGVAREIAAMTGAKLKEPSYAVTWGGPPIEGRVSLEIRSPGLNPRFVLGLVEGISVGPSPYAMQRRLRLAGMRPINCIVDATNYVMLEIGEPLHAFDYDVLVRRAGGKMPTIITRLAEHGERLTTLDGVERELKDFTVLVCDGAGALSIAGVMGGAESEVSERTTRVLLEGAAWDFINIRRTVSALRLSSEASYRFERGVHPAMAERGVRRGLELMRRVTGGKVARGLVDAYPAPPEAPEVEITPQDVDRWLGIQLQPKEIASLLRRQGFRVRASQGVLRVQPPDHRLDIGAGVVGKADLMEEIARIKGYADLPETMISDQLPPLYGDPGLELEERVRDLLVGLGLQEVVSYRLTHPDREARRLKPGSPTEETSYVRLANPIGSDREVMRQSVLASVLEAVERNVKFRERMTLFEIGPIFLPRPGEMLPEERSQLVVVMRGPREPRGWQEADNDPMDFYDVKGVVDAFLRSLHVEGRFAPCEHPSFHPGKCAQLSVGDGKVGVLGELHPLVCRSYDLGQMPVAAAELDLDGILACVPEHHALLAIAAFPPVLEDLAVVVDEGLPAEKVEQVIRKAGGKWVVDARLFDHYRGEQIGPGKKSLAYSVVYQAPDRTLTDEEVAKVRKQIVASLEKDLGAKLRS